MLTSILYFIGSIMFFFLFVFFFLKNLKNPGLYVHNYSLTFLAMFFFTFSISVPVIVFPDQLQVAVWGNIVATASLFTLMLLCLDFLLVITNHFLKKNFKLLKTIIVLSGIITVSIQIMTPSNPSINDLTVIWNTNVYARYIFLAIAVPYGIFWFHLFYNVSLLLKEKEIRNRMIQLGVLGVIYAIAAILLFAKEDPVWQLIAMLLFVSCNMIITMSLVSPYVLKPLNKPVVQVA